MQLHNLKPNNKKKSKKRVGRGGKRGAYSGKGMKGQKSRAGHRIRPQIRDIIKKLPKKRGYKFKSIKEKPVIINVGLLEKKFKEGETINFNSLFNAGLVSKKFGKIPKVKILSEGNLSKKFSVSEFQISKSAREKIVAAGGSIEKVKI